VVVRLAVEIAGRTGGAFDPTFASCGRLWSFPGQVVPSDDALAACLESVDWTAIEIDGGAGTVFLPRPGMRIGIAGVGKGWVLDRAADVLRARGLRDFSVDGGGDLVLSGRGPRGRWVLGIADPRKPGELHGTFEAPDGAVVTSGDYMQSFERDGVLYHHILDPHTGRPARRSSAITVIAPDAATADALATGLFVIGPDAGLPWVESNPGVEALYFDPDGKARASSGFPAVRTDR
jgi:thiamine biosynthesis lipoprotein